MNIRLILTGLLALSCAAASAQTVPVAPPGDGAAKRATLDRPIPMAPPRHPRHARVFDLGAIDIPQWAKDAGHNGRATYRVMVAANGTVTDIQLKTSSGSPAIDEAALKTIQAAHFIYATDKDGHAVAGETHVYREFARWDDESPGGGLDDYRCADLTREYDWFRKAHNNVSPPIFALENYHVSLDMLANVEGVDRRDRAAVTKQRDKYMKQWLSVVKQCRKAPKVLLLDKVKDPVRFRSLVETF